MHFRLSHSKLDTLSRCPQLYYRRYILHEPDVLGAPLILGRAFHTALEANFNHKMVHDVDLGKNEIARIYRDSFDDEANKPVFKDLETLTEDQVDWAGQDPKELRAIGQKALLRYHEKHAPFMNPAGVEQRIEKEFTIGEHTITLVGILDMITTQGTVVDYKLVSYVWPQPRIETSMQPTIYATLLGKPINFDYHFIVKSPKKGVGISIRRTQRTGADIHWFTDVHLPQVVEMLEHEIYVRNPGMQCVNCANRLGCGYRVG